MNKDEMKKFAHSLIKVIWEDHNAEKLADFYDHNLEGYYNDDPVTFELLEKKVHIFKEHIPSLKVEVLDLIIEDQTFVLHANQNIERDGKCFKIPSILMAEVNNGKIIKYWLKTQMSLEFNGQ